MSVRLGTFRVQNTLGIRTADLTWSDDTNMLVVGGENGAGKTSLCDAIWMALGGAPKQSMVIHSGADSSKVELELVDSVSGKVELIVQRVTKLKGDKEVSSLVVMGADRRDYKSPQDVLNKLINKFTFDPMDLIGLSGAEQAKRFKKLIGWEEEEKTIDAEHKAINNQIAEVERQQSIHFGRMAGAVYDPKMPKDPVSTESIMVELKAAEEHNSSRSPLEVKVGELRTQLSAKDAAIESKKSQIQILLEQIKALEADVEKLGIERAFILTEGQAANAELRAFQLVDTTEIQEKLANLGTTNAAITANNNLLVEDQAWQTLETQRVELETKRLASLESKRQRYIARLKAANLPEGFEVVNEELFLNGIPFSQVNTAEQMKASCQLSLLGNPQLRLVHIGHGESLTKKNLEALRALASEMDFQVLVELACSAEEVALGVKSPEVIIQDGEPVDETTFVQPYLDSKRESSEGEGN
jgi:DNA repair exonuclease SbcCD ATPase subunit